MPSINDLPAPPTANRKSAGINDLPPPPAKQGPTEGQSALRGALSGVTAGFDDEITGALGAVGRLAGYKNLGSFKPGDPNHPLESTDEPLSADEIVKAYRDNRDAIRDEQKLDMATNPKSTIAGNLAGSVLSPASKIKSASTGMKGAMLTGAAQGAVFGAGGSDSDLTKGEVGQFAKDTTMGVGLGAAVPPALKVAGAVAKGAGNAAGFTGKKLFSTLFGVSEENASKYLARREAVNAAPELAEIKSQVDDAVMKLSRDVDSGKMHFNDAKTALSDLKEQVSNSLTDAKVDAKEALRRTEDMFKEAAANAIQPLKDHRPPTALAHDVVNAVDDLKSQVVSKSGQAQQVLDNTSAKIDLNPVYQRIDETIDKLKTYKTPEADSVASKLQDYKTGLMSENWANIDAPSAKRRLQGLDQITQYSPLAGSFDQAKNAAFKGVRSKLDEVLKEGVPEYRSAMEPVAKDASLLGEVSPAFGDERKAIGRLGQVATPKGELDRKALQQLEEATGRKGAFTGPIDQYTRAQAILKNPEAVEAMKRSLPEYDAYRQAMAKLAKMRPDWTRDQLENALSNSKEARTLSAAEDAFSQAKAKFEPISSLTPESTQAKLESFGRPRGAPIENVKAFQALEKTTGKQFIQPMADRAVLDSFSKTYSHGSRNTVIWTVLGTMFGGLPGASAGAVYGQVVDRYGPKMGKAILDGIGKVRENPSIETIRSLGLPENIKQEIEREFRVYASLSSHGESAAPLKVADGDPETDRKPAQRGEDTWAQRGADKIGLSGASLDQAMQSKEVKRLLIEASDLPAGSPALKRIMDKIQKAQGQK